MGILNVTPDSFSDGRRFLGRDAALAQAERMVREGATLIDVGGESTRPGAEEVPVEEELRRTEFVVREVAARFPVAVSIDTTKFEVARAALEAGATWINDISGGRDIRFAELAREFGASVILMHMQGTPRTMQASPHYPRGVVEEVGDFLAKRREAFREAGVSGERIWIDPGIGFGKTLEHNLQLLRNLDRLSALGPVAVGTSRKSFLARLLGDPELPMEEREAGTLATHLWAVTRGARMVRVHDVGNMVRALRTWEALKG